MYFPAPIPSALPALRLVWRTWIECEERFDVNAGEPMKLRQYSARMEASTKHWILNERELDNRVLNSRICTSSADTLLLQISFVKFY